MGNNLQFKLGAYADLSTSGDIANGDICFGTYSSTQGTLAIKHNSKIMSVLPPPGTSGYPLVGQGENLTPLYSSSIRIKKITLFDIVNNEEWQVLAHSTDTSNKEFTLRLGTPRIKNADNTYDYTKMLTGRIQFYSTFGQYCILQPREDVAAQNFAKNSYTYIFLPGDGSEARHAYLAWSKWNSSTPINKGSSDTPVYLDANAQILACDGNVITNSDQSFPNGIKSFNSLYPANNNGSLGGNNNKWESLYVTNAYSKNIYPVDNNGYLGSDDNRWGGFYVNKIYLFNSNGGRVAIKPNQTFTTTDCTFYLPDMTGSATAAWVPLSSSGVGTENRPVFATNNGLISPITCLSIAYGGTGTTGIYSNRLLFKEGDMLTTGTHAINSDRITIGETNFYTGNDLEGDILKLYVSGTCRLGWGESHRMIVGGKFVLANVNGLHYGTDAPQSKINNPVQGQIYFHII